MSLTGPGGPMVDEQLVSRGITNPRVLDAMRRVPRHEFVPESQRQHAYAARFRSVTTRPSRSLSLSAT